ncbi:hypothetical protein TRFO_36116 [Tritrichomonas foetus]|uniref:Importin N-terminal domain-containing protein n=1 Tax=Tritrichomonas foetus TaxID=1144522 RepID=A0A1J4JEY2_9EUKA|nr:hypothetical protein TRFO_36116 [Tritrichomonas foetus]|eukprot:OHS97664.1 hypothetical protein TRFO_36116 [Tritrichomonas foetus]
MEAALHDLILQTTNPETVNQVTEQLQQILQNPEAIPALFNLFISSENDIVKRGSLTYLHQVISNKWPKISPTAQAQTKQMLLSLFTQQINPIYFKMICEIISAIYRKDIGEWDELISGIFENWQSQPFIISQVLMSIIDLFAWESYENQIPQFILMVQSFISSSEIPIQLAGLKIFSAVIETIPDFDDNINFYTMANQIALNSMNFQPDDFASVWNSMSTILMCCSSMETPNVEFLESVRNTAFQVISNRNLESTLRILPLTTIINNISFYSNFIEPILDFSIDVIAQTIEETEILPFDLLELIDSVLKSQERTPMYNTMSSKLFVILNSGSLPHMTAALLTLRLLLVETPDCAHKDAQKIIEIIKTSINSGNPLFIQAAASVVETFDETFQSMNVFGVELLKGILPFIISPITEVRHHCIKAALIICDNLDTEIPQFFDTVWNLYQKSSPDDLQFFFTLIACSIKLTPEFNDENVEAVLSLLQNVIKKQDLVAIASSMTIIHALMSFDSDLCEQLLPMILPSIDSCLQFANFEVVGMAVSFLRDCITFFHEAAAQIIVPFIPRLISFITENEIIGIKAASLVTLSRFCKYSVSAGGEQKTLNSIAPVLLDVINKSFDNDSVDIQISASQSIRALIRILNDEQKFEFYQKLVNIVSFHIEIRVIEDALRSIARIIKISQQQKMIEIAMNLLSNIINGQVTFLHGLPLLQIDAAIFLFRNICRLVTSLIAVNCPISQQICEFMLEWLKRDSELDKSTAVGSLSDAILYDTVTPEICSTIVSTVAEIMPSATDPGFQENIIYLFNICVIKQRHLIPSIMGVMNLFLGWWQNANANESGYSEVLDNLSSLFLGLAIAVPEFPEDVLCQVFDKFPRADNMNNANMCMNILSFLDERKNIGSELQHKVALSIARLFMLDKMRLDDMGINNELLQQMQAILLTILRAMPPVLHEIKQMCSRSKARAKRLSAVISNL